MILFWDNRRGGVPRAIFIAHVYFPSPILKFCENVTNVTMHFAEAVAIKTTKLSDKAELYLF